MHFVLAILPIFVLMVTLLALKWPAKYASILTFAVTLAEFVFVYKPGMPAAFMCGVQSISGSVAGAIGPTTTSLTAAATGNGGNESVIYRYTLLPTIMTTCILGIMNVIIMNIIS